MEQSRQTRRPSVRARRRRATAARRRELWLAVVVAVVLGPLTPRWVGAQALPRYLVIEPAVSTKLEALAQGLHHEIALCLRGAVEGDTARADDFVMPVPRRSTAQASTFSACPAETLALWHNHPMPVGGRPSAYLPTRRLRSEPVTNPLSLCAMSQHDIATTVRLGFPFAVIAVGDTWCWWTQQQVRAFDDNGLVPGPRFPTQTFRGLPPAATVAGDLQ